MLRYLSTLWSWILPSRCLICRRDGEYVCANCSYRLPPAVDAPTDTIALYDYQDTRVKKLIWSLKYRRLKSVAPVLGRLLADRLLEELAEIQALHPAIPLPWLVVPIPLSRERERHRGFNQATLLGEALVTHQPATFKLAVGVLQKIKDTPTQVSLANRHARLNNLRGALTLGEPAVIRSRGVILLDDVTTTGATLAEGERVLRAAQPRLIVKAALAQD